MSARIFARTSAGSSKETAPFRTAFRARQSKALDVVGKDDILRCSGDQNLKRILPGGPAMESGVPEFRGRRMDPALLAREGSPSTPKMNLQLLERSNKRATENIVIHKYIVISVLHN
jgi:hypothetical protein